MFQPNKISVFFKLLHMYVDVTWCVIIKNWTKVDKKCNAILRNTFRINKGLFWSKIFLKASFETADKTTDVFLAGGDSTLKKLASWKALQPDLKLLLSFGGPNTAHDDTSKFLWVINYPEKMYAIVT